MKLPPFDPLESRKILDGPIGFQRYLAKDLKTEQGYSAVGNCAGGMLTAAIDCILVGYRASARKLLSKCKTWYEYAIERDEKPRGYESWATEAMRYRSVALCNWLLCDVDDLENSKKAVGCWESYNAEHPDFDKAETSIVLPEYIDARAYKEALAFFDTTPGMNKPASPARVKTEGQMSYVIAAMHERKEYTFEEVTGALGKFLKRSAARLLADGQSAAVARWMKIAHFNEVSHPLPAEEALLKVYDYLPNVEFPGYAES